MAEGQWLPCDFIRWQKANSPKEFTPEKERIGAVIEPCELHRVESLLAGNLPAIRWMGKYWKVTYLQVL